MKAIVRIFDDEIMQVEHECEIAKEATEHSESLSVLIPGSEIKERFKIRSIGLYRTDESLLWYREFTDLQVVLCPNDDLHLTMTVRIGEIED